MTTFMPPPPAATFLAFHPQDNNIIAIGMDDSTIQIYNVRVDEVVMNYCKCLIWLWQIIEVHYSYSNLITQVKSKLKGHSKRITGLAFSHVLNVLVSSGADAQVQLITTFFCFYNVLSIQQYHHRPKSCNWDELSLLLHFEPLMCYSGKKKWELVIIEDNVK